MQKWNNINEVAQEGHVGWNFWFRWILVNAVGCSVGIASIFVLATFLDPGSLIFFAIPSVPMGIAQWFVLRRQISGAKWWIMVITFAVCVGFLIIGGVGSFLMLLYGVDYVLEGLAGFIALYGASSGFIIWWLLNRPSLVERRKVETM